MRNILAWVLVLASTAAHGQACYTTSVLSPSPFMGNHGEIFRTAEGAIFEVIGSYEYLYAYYPRVTLCPDRGRMLIEGKNITVKGLQAAQGQRPPVSPKSNRVPDQQQRLPNSTAQTKVVLRVSGCDYFVADGPSGYLVIEWYGGYDPDRGDGIFGDVRGYGFRDVLYDNGRDGRVYIDDYLLSRDSAVRKLRDHCK